MRALFFIAALSAVTANAATMTTTFGPHTTGNPMQSMIQMYTSTSSLAYAPIFNRIEAGINSAEVTVDDVSDTSVINGISYKAPNATTASTSVTTNATIQTLVTPANFPDPPVYRTISGDYTARLIWNGITTTAPSFLSSTTAPVLYDIGSMGFFSKPRVTGNYPDLAFSGVLEISGPESMTTLPVTATYHANSGPSSPKDARLEMTSVSDVTLKRHRVGYSLAGSQYVGPAFVDELNVRLILPTFFNVDYFTPEPTSIAMCLGLAVGCLGLNRVAGKRRAGRG